MESNWSRREIYKILEVTRGKKSTASIIFNAILLTTISLNTFAIILHSVKSLRHDFDIFFSDFEYFSVVFFTIEYFVRLWVCVENEKYQHPVWGRIRYIFSAGALVDLLAIMPFYLSNFTSDTGLIRILRLFRIFRLFKFSRYVHALKVIESVFREKREELILSFVFFLFTLLISSSMMYYIENSAQPKVFSSIPATLWWGVTTITSVGYGDTYPITPLGKLLGGFVAVAGVAMFALPTGIFVSGFNEHIKIYKNEDKNMKFCPHCGEKLH
ncbi:ion transporter [Arcicella sp. DC2W]|uniref:Ion transporter n=1 Tax=Arcicella gelida TaxID=2984195 RepID=A0ABU5S0D9_9BACT|nr:ion transporter [Arcicella sp. DC2W]MEA5401861.1 ion transporter [Arcicella sp. DC2W]